MHSGWWVVVRRLVAWSASAGVVPTLCLACAVTSSHAADALPAADFFRHPVLTQAVMSPNGKHVAALMSGGPQKRRRLVIVNLKDVASSKVVAGFGDADIARVRWVNDDRLVFTVVDEQAPTGEQFGHGLFTVDREGTQTARRLIKVRRFWVSEPPRPGERELGPEHGFVSTLGDGSNDVVIGRATLNGRGEQTGVVLLRLDTVNARTRSISDGAPAGVFEWAIDGRGVPRIAVTAKDGRSRMHWKPTADAAEWVSLREFDTFGGSGRPPHVIAVDADNRLYAVGLAGSGADTTSLLRIDVQGGELKSQPLLSLAGFDFSGQLIFDAKGELLGVQFISDAPGSHWYDPRLKAIQQKIDEQLPATNNRIDCGDCADPAMLLVASTSDRQPVVYRLYDAASGRLDLLAQSRPWINPALMATRDFKRFAARDGLSIPVHITLPRGVKGPAPTVVLVHGGPWLRGGHWRWDADAQFLASRGYAVIEPEFRGSAGFGDRHFRASWKQWGLAMQDDVADTARWAVEQGLADPKRICIAGASYGGYATLMGLIRDPDLFRCGVEWVGVSDIDLMYSIGWSDASEMWTRHGMPVLVGDREKDAAQLAATSPLKLAARLKQPLLMAYGGEDRRVPIDHGTRMRDALRPHNPDVEFVVYPGEAHRWMLESTQLDFWGRVERFLARHLGPPAAP